VNVIIATSPTPNTNHADSHHHLLYNPAHTSHSGRPDSKIRRYLVNYPRLLLASIAALIVFFAWGFLTEGWLLRKEFATSAALYRRSDLQKKYMPFGLVSVLVALLAAVALYAGWCGGTSGAIQGLVFGLLMGVFVACVHPISNLITMNMDLRLGLVITATNAIGWVLAGLVIGLVYKPLTP
jgi:MFS family permease